MSTELVAIQSRLFSLDCLALLLTSAALANPNLPQCFTPNQSVDYCIYGFMDTRGESQTTHHLSRALTGATGKTVTQ